MSYVLSREAARDIEEIEDYTARTWGDAQAEAYINDLFQVFQKLAEQPNLGRLRIDVPAPYMVYAVGSHLIIYRHNQKLDRVEVLNVLHPSMDIKGRLNAALRRLRGKGGDYEP